MLKSRALNVCCIGIFALVMVVYLGRDIEVSVRSCPRCLCDGIKWKKEEERAKQEKVFESVTRKWESTIAKPGGPENTEPEKRTAQRIPKIIHQIYKDSQIPDPYHEHIRSWIDNHPDWKYYFWTDSDAERMIFERYPQFKELYKKYTYPLCKSDAMRYFILHQYGGVYADLDMRSLKNIEEFLGKNTCIISPEPQVQTNLIFNLDKSLTNCIMMSVPNHPMLTEVLNGLPGAFRDIKENVDVLHSTGPFFLNKTHLDFSFKHDCKGKYCDVYIPDHKFLVPRFDVPDIKFNVNEICVKQDIGNLQRKACEKLTNSNYENALPLEAVTDHSWLHLGWNNVKEQNEKDGKKFPTKDIRELVPNVITYS